MTCISIWSMPNAFNRYEVDLTCLKSSIGGWIRMTVMEQSKTVHQKIAVKYPTLLDLT
jgi:hypothetical protein